MRGAGSAGDSDVQKGVYDGETSLNVMIGRLQEQVGRYRVMRLRALVIHLSKIPGWSSVFKKPEREPESRFIIQKLRKFS